MSIIIRNKQDYFRLEYEIDVEDGEIIIPNLTFNLNFNILINGHKLQIDTYNNNFLYEFAKFATNSTYFTNLGYETNLNVSSENYCSFNLQLKCQVFNTGHYQALSKFKEVTITLHWLSKQDTCTIQNMLDPFNYLLTSWLLQVEEKYPFVFSVIGREYVKLNMYWYCKTRSEVLQDSPEIEKILQILKSYIKEKYETMVLLRSKGKLNRFASGRSKNIVGSFSLKILDE